MHLDNGEFFIAKSIASELGMFMIAQVNYQDASVQWKFVVANSIASELAICI